MPPKEKKPKKPPGLVCPLCGEKLSTDTTQTYLGEVVTLTCPCGFRFVRTPQGDFAVWRGDA